MINMSNLLALLMVLSAGAAGTARAEPEQPPRARSVVLVHGAWADGSSWDQVIPYLQAKGLAVASVQNPLTSLADDVAATRRVLAMHEGPTVLVGHSYAGSVITEAGVDPRVTALVYVAARAPDANEDFVEVAKRFPTMPVRAGVITNDGFSYLQEEAFLKYFADGVPATKARTLFSVQQPIASDLFAGRTTVAAWREKPSWYVVSRSDNTTSPDLQRYLAQRMGARTVELESGHLSLVSHPQQVAEAILEAAGY